MSKTLETNSVVAEVQNRKRNNLKRKATSELPKNILVVRLSIKFYWQTWTLYCIRILLHVGIAPGHSRRTRAHPDLDTLFGIRALPHARIAGELGHIRTYSANMLHTSPHTGDIVSGHTRTHSNSFLIVYVGVMPYQHIIIFDIRALPHARIAGELGHIRTYSVNMLHTSPHAGDIVCGHTRAHSNSCLIVGVMY